METPRPIYEIRVAGHLSPQWTDWFEGLTITLEEDGNTLLTARWLIRLPCMACSKKSASLACSQSIKIIHELQPSHKE